MVYYDRYLITNLNRGPSCLPTHSLILEQYLSEHELTFVSYALLHHKHMRKNNNGKKSGHVIAVIA